jgi:hypothetical protein
MLVRCPFAWHRARLVLGPIDPHVLTSKRYICFMHSARMMLRAYVLPSLVVCVSNSFLICNSAVHLFMHSARMMVCAYALSRLAAWVCDLILVRSELS